MADFLPSLEEYVDRIVSRRAGGLCWTLARGFHFLLTDLGFDASLMIMAPGHFSSMNEKSSPPMTGVILGSTRSLPAIPRATSTANAVWRS